MDIFLKLSIYLQLRVLTPQWCGRNRSSQMSQDPVLKTVWWWGAVWGGPEPFQKWMNAFLGRIWRVKLQELCFSMHFFGLWRGEMQPYTPYFLMFFFVLCEIGFQILFAKGSVSNRNSTSIKTILTEGCCWIAILEDVADTFRRGMYLDEAPRF